MRPIPREMVETVWRQIIQAPPARANAWMLEIEQAQPFLLTFLVALDEKCAPDHKKGFLGLLGFIIWKVMTQGGQSVGLITPEALEAAEQTNVHRLYELCQGPEPHFYDVIIKMLASYNQAPLWGAVVESLMVEKETDTAQEDDKLALAMVHLKTVIDCLDR
jgi:hypothetical protein